MTAVLRRPHTAMSMASIEQFFRPLAAVVPAVAGVLARPMVRVAAAGLRAR